MSRATAKFNVEGRASSRSSNDDVVIDWFQAVTPYGEVGLTLAAGRAGAHREVTVLRQALNLGRVEPLIRDLEDWLVLPLDFSPCAPEALRRGFLRGTVTVSGAEPADELRVDLHLPQGLLGKTTAPPLPLATRINWQPISCDLILGQFMLPSSELAAVEPGGMVLVPESFESRWRCSLVSCDQTAYTPFAELEAAAGRLVLMSGAQVVKAVEGRGESSSADGGVRQKAVTLVAPWALTVSADRLAGWDERATVPLERGLAELDLILMVDDVRVAEGSLIPLGAGYGLFIKAVMAELGKEDSWALMPAEVAESLSPD